MNPAQQSTDMIPAFEDYDINVGRYLVQGVDVWLNNPRRPLEASGTSGMKVVLNAIDRCSYSAEVSGNIDARLSCQHVSLFRAALAMDLGVFP